MKKQFIIIVAGGKGLRMGAEVPKQFLPLCGKPVLMHTLNAFYQYSSDMQIVLVLPEEQQAHWKELCDKFRFAIPHQVVVGGETRFHSVQNGLKLVPENVIVGIHDGVRPLVSQSLITRCFEAAEKYGAAFPVVPVIDTLRKSTESGSVIVNREEYCLVQTPQVFESEMIKTAYEKPYSEKFTDDVSVVELQGNCQVMTVEGGRENLKITTPVDLAFAEALLINAL